MRLNCLARTRLGLNVVRRSDAAIRSYSSKHEQRIHSRRVCEHDVRVQTIAHHEDTTSASQVLEIVVSNNRFHHLGRGLAHVNGLSTGRGLQNRKTRPGPWQLTVRGRVRRVLVGRNE